jgi:hypothetical protein
MEKAQEITASVSSGVIDAVVQKSTNIPLTVLSAADKITQGEVGEAINEVKNGVIRDTIATNLPFLDVVRIYRGSLRESAKGKWQKLPDRLIEILTPHYDIDFAAVDYATGINTGHGQAITFEYQIYFPRDIDLTEINDLHWMLHELEHVQQYKGLGGFEPFMLHYFAGAGVKIIQSGRINIHDEIPLEEAADRKADNIIDEVYAAYATNNTSIRVMRYF